MKIKTHSMKLLLIAVLMATVFCLAPTHTRQAVAANDKAVIEAPKDLAGYRAIENKVKAVVKKVMPAVVGIRIGHASGSGVIVSEDGVVMTAGHVVAKPGQDVTFIFPDGKTAKGKSLGMTMPMDLGLMKITDKGKWPVAPRGDSDSLKPGAWVVAFGHPLGYRPGRPPVVRIGRVLEITGTVIRTDCPLVGGDSGGPLFDLDGKIVGINSRIAGPADVNLHAPANLFRPVWDRLLKGESWKTDLPSRDDAEVIAPFREVVKAANKCVVRVKCGGKDAALGTIVGPDGWILTKASELKGKVVCRLADGRDLEAKIVGIHPKYDLAMLKIDAVDLPIIPWKTGKSEVGQWLISAGMGDDPLAVGVISVPRRAIPAIGGAIGIQLGDKDGAALVMKVIPKSPADQAGLKDNDIITHVNGKTTANSADVRNLVRRYPPGHTVTLTIKRGDEILNKSVKLGKLSTPAMKKRDKMNSLGVGVSRRSDNFPAVLQHDTVLKPVDCGGPVVDLSGRVVGINIAHAGRTETYCIPTDQLIAPLYELICGRLSPSLLEAAKKAATEKQAAAAKKAAEQKAAEEKAAKEKKLAEEKAAAEKKAAEEKKLAAEKAAKAKKD